MSDDKIMNLELKVLHLENSLEELNQVVYNQHKKIDDLEAALKKVTEIIKGTGEPEIGPANEKPPHY